MSRTPTLAQLEDIALDLGLDLTPERLRAVFRADGRRRRVVQRRRRDARREAARHLSAHAGLPARAGGETEHNAWYVKTEIKGTPGGRLAGKRVAIKDNVCIAGVPMMNGAATLEGYVPDIDATIVTRMLDAGATILGKAHCEVLLPCPAAAIPAHRARCTTRTSAAIRPAARPPAPARWSRPARSTWRSAATRAARSGSRPRSAASTA